MTASLSYNSTDLGQYGLLINYVFFPAKQDVSAAQLQNGGVALSGTRPVLPLTVKAEVLAASHSALLTALDNIKSVLNQREDCRLDIDSYTDRYWEASFQEMTGEITSPITWKGSLSFLLASPYAYATSQTSHNHTVDEDPESLSETAGGTEKVLPVITLTADTDLGEGTVEINNSTTGEVLEWTGEVDDGDILVFDCASYLVTLNSTENMTTVDGEFPYLNPGANTVVISGFHGTANFTYRARYM